MWGVNDFTMLEVTLSVFLFFHHSSFYRQTEIHPASTQGPGCLMKGNASVWYCQSSLLVILKASIVLIPGLPLLRLP